MSDPWPWLVAAVSGYLVGSVPVAVIVGRRFGVDPRRAGDRNPGYWNMRASVGRRRAVPVFVGDALKGVLAGLVGQALGGSWLTYGAVGAAMIGHAWPVFARFRGGRCILTFAGGIAVISPRAALISLAACIAVALLAHSFALGARVGVFGVPVAQLIFDRPNRVAGTGALMGLIGFRFAMAWAGSRRDRSP